MFLRRGLLSLVVIAASLCLPLPGHAGEFPEHWSLVYFVARVAGYDMRDARLIADASWAVDQNEATTAGPSTQMRNVLLPWLKEQMDTGQLDRVVNDRAALERIAWGEETRYLSQGVLLHALTKQSNRAAAIPLFQRWIADQTRAGTPGSRELRLVLTGMMLHYVVDAGNHPEQGWYGHFFEWHQRDRIPNHPDEYVQAAMATYGLLREMAPVLAPGGLARRDRLVQQYGLDRPLEQSAFFASTVRAI